MRFAGQRRLVAGVIALASVGVSESALAFELVTPAEVQREVIEGATAAPRFRVRANPDKDAPVIDVVAPARLSGLKTPFPVELRFSSGPGAQIDPNSFKVTYGFLGIDLTDRIRKSAVVTPQGIRAENVEIPTGQHRLTVRIADSVQRTSEREIKLSVD
jgi:hypothetical protein